mmetsp:Transcript_38682/g.114932  ORF Transcript_38682/g.114932 Transcript_38682/m.114932 type:complete len:205 (-) Transcript_38682:3458-4072(-)
MGHPGGSAQVAAAGGPAVSIHQQVPGRDAVAVCKVSEEGRQRERGSREGQRREEGRGNGAGGGDIACATGVRCARERGVHDKRYFETVPEAAGACKQAAGRPAAAGAHAGPGGRRRPVACAAAVAPCRVVRCLEGRLGHALACACVCARVAAGQARRRGSRARARGAGCAEGLVQRVAGEAASGDEPQGRLWHTVGVAAGMAAA